MRLSNLELFYNRQEQEEVRPLYGASLFSLTTEYKKFKVDNAQWHQLSMKKRYEHNKRFCNYKSNLTDAYKKPCNSGRKPGTYTKSKHTNKEPEFVVDCLTSEKLE